MASTKVVINVAVTFTHPDGTRIRKAAISSRIRTILEGRRDDDYAYSMSISKASVRAVDFD